MKNDNATVDNVKIVFFDVLAKQIGSMIELKDKMTTATGETFDQLSNDFESQFELIRDTLNNVEKLMGNVEKFDSAKKGTTSVPSNNELNISLPDTPKTDSVPTEENNVQGSEETDDIDDTDIEEATAENKFITPPTDEKADEPVEISPLIPVSPAAEKATEDLIKNYNISFDNIKAEAKKEESEETKEEDKSEAKPPVPLVPENILANNENKEETTTSSTDVEPDDIDDEGISDDEEVKEPEVEEKPEETKPDLVNIPEGTGKPLVPEKFVKQSDKQTKAIVVNVQQLEKLRSSRAEQEQKLDFGIAAPASNETSAEAKTDDDAEIQKLLAQASELYKQGNAIEAEKIYQQIRELNKK